jgi:RNase adapter protein RapZ
MRFVIVTGLSGAGKTQVVRCLEDLGFFCVDNLPPTLIPKFAELCAQSQGKINKIALVIDIRGGDFFDNIVETLDKLKADGIGYEILFLEASDETLVRRFKESRRRHPLNPQGGVLAGITEERKRLEEIKGLANRVIDTSNRSTKELKEELVEVFADNSDDTKVIINVVSFGYKYGIPMDADLVMDVRFLPNPFYIAELRNFTGNDKLVQDYVLQSETSQAFIQKFHDLIDFLLPHYIAEGKTSLTVAIGCTGGQHRSVTLINKIGAMIKEKGYKVVIQHRDVIRNSSGAGKKCD